MALFTVLISVAERSWISIFLAISFAKSGYQHNKFIDIFQLTEYIWGTNQYLVELIQKIGPSHK